MQVSKVQLSKATQTTIKKIIEASKEKTSRGQQMEMASYYAFLHSENNAANDVKNFAKTLLGE